MKQIKIVFLSEFTTTMHSMTPAISKATYYCFTATFSKGIFSGFEKMLPNRGFT